MDALMPLFETGHATTLLHWAITVQDAERVALLLLVGANSRAPVRLDSELAQPPRYYHALELSPLPPLFIQILLDPHIDANKHILPFHYENPIAPLDYACDCAWEFGIIWLIERRGATPSRHTLFHALLDLNDAHINMTTAASQQHLRIAQRLVTVYGLDPDPFRSKLPRAVAMVDGRSPTLKGSLQLTPRH